jgi:hypothetical protein
VCGGRGIYSIQLAKLQRFATPIYMQKVERSHLGQEALYPGRRLVVFPIPPVKYRHIISNYCRLLNQLNAHTTYTIV